MTLKSGEYNYVIDEDWGSKSGSFVVLLDTEVSIIIILSTVEKINIDIESFVKLQNVGFNVSSDYLNEYLGGLLILIFIIIFAEILVLTLISFYIFTEIIRFIIIQSKKDIMIMKSIGATYFTNFKYIFERNLRNYHFSSNFFTNWISFNFGRGYFHLMLQYFLDTNLNQIYLIYII